ncbi:MAG: hypothetical protein OXP71_08960 [Candidatus Poribacteria bacterium]|nr:hypothetical protein [Candidatus Poribacteria bacterium]
MLKIDKEIQLILKPDEPVVYRWRAERTIHNISLLALIMDF